MFILVCGVCIGIVSSQNLARGVKVGGHVACVIPIAPTTLPLLFVTDQVPVWISGGEKFVQNKIFYIMNDTST